MTEIWTYLIITGATFIIVACSALIGAFILFKGKSTIPNESFIGETKGDVFSISDGMDADFPDEPSKAEANILKKTEQFLKNLGG